MSFEHITIECRTPVCQEACWRTTNISGKGWDASICLSQRAAIWECQSERVCFNRPCPKWESSWIQLNPDWLERGWDWITQLQMNRDNNAEWKVRESMQNNAECTSTMNPKQSKCQVHWNERIWFNETGLMTKTMKNEKKVTSITFKWKKDDIQ